MYCICFTNSNAYILFCQFKVFSKKKKEKRSTVLILMYLVVFQQEQRAEEEERVQATERRAAQSSERARKNQALESQVLNTVSNPQVSLVLTPFGLGFCTQDVTGTF